MVGLLGVYLDRLRRRPVRRLVVAGCVGGSEIEMALKLVFVVLEGLGSGGGFDRFP